MKTQFNLPKIVAQFISAIAIMLSGMFMFASCSKDDASQPSASSQSVSDPSGLRTDPPVISMSVFKCAAGNCAEFDFQAYLDGSISYNGYSNVGKFGHLDFLIDPVIVANMAKFANDNGFFKLKSAYAVFPGKSQTNTFARYKQSKNTVIEFGVDIPANLVMMKQTFLDKLGISPLIAIQAPPPVPVISLKRDGNAGQFAQYNVTLYADGRMVYEGLSGLPAGAKTGIVEEAFTIEVVNSLIDIAKQNGFLDFKDAYPFAPDQQGTQTTITIGGNTKSVSDHNTPEVPETLLKIQNAIEDNLRIRELTGL